MEIYPYLSKLYGLTDIISKNNDNVDSNGNEIKEVIISIDDVTQEVNENYVKTPKKVYERKTPRFIINNMYRLFILIILWCECLHPIISSAITNNVRFFVGSFFSYMFFSQYIFGVLLHKNEYYNIILQKIHYNKYNLYMSIAYVCCFVISLILAVVPVFSSGYIINIYNLTDNNIYARVFLTTYFVTNRLYSYNIFFVNGIIFALLMYLHCCDIRNYKKSLELMIDENIMDININNTIKEYTDIKGTYADSVKNMNNLCASIIIFGLIGCYFTVINIKTGNNNVYSYIDAGCCLVVLSIYIISISIITNTVNDIKSLIDSPKFVAIFLNRSNFAIINGDTYNDYIKDNLSEMTPLMKEKLSEPHSPNQSSSANPPPSPNSFSMSNMNFPPSPISNRSSSPMSNINSKSVSSSSKTNNNSILRQNSIPKINSISSSPNGKYINNRMIVDTVEQLNNSDDMNKKIDFIKTIVFREMIITTENGINLDWIILYNKLADPWERFVVCGFEINDSQIFQQILALGSGALGVLEISKMIG